MSVTAGDDVAFSQGPGNFGLIVDPVLEAEQRRDGLFHLPQLVKR